MARKLAPDLVLHEADDAQTTRRTSEATSSSNTDKMWWCSTTTRTILSIRWCVLTRQASHGSRKRVYPYLQARRGPTTQDMNVTMYAICFCLSSLRLVCVRSKSENDGPGKRGPSVCIDDRYRNAEKIRSARSLREMGPSKSTGCTHHPKVDQALRPVSLAQSVASSEVDGRSDRLSLPARHLVGWCA